MEQKHKHFFLIMAFVFFNCAVISSISVLYIVLPKDSHLLVCENQPAFTEYLESINVKSVPTMLTIENNEVVSITDGFDTVSTFFDKKLVSNTTVPVSNIKMPEFIFKNVDGEVIKPNGSYHLYIFKKGCKECDKIKSWDYKEPYYKVILE